MIAKKIYIPELGDDFNETVRDLMGTASDTQEDVYLQWNGATLHITPTSVYEEIAEEYDSQMKAMGTVYDKASGRLISIDTLSKKIANLLIKL